ncbi:hypothetical protein [Caulobacter sp. UNC279MFTsu5.1]|uniref:hypothetical protein n=1 Tax=Caulobacter sp. UNC279MFTsu5.1 TaxID=1502775 RepID=UPI0008DFC25F|nr:hypothetical protein [Caulobacter sp. UNC279MFTsu5.1]SFK54592.1 hypothetical protein SAMN02799626_04573 [Caulobacter sp. UNC279MFTsu5.1]
MKDTPDQPGRPPLPGHDASPDPAAKDRPTGGPRPLRILLACNYDAANAATVCDHINAFVRYSRHEVRVLSKVGEIFDGVTLSAFDAVVIHYSLFLAMESFVGPRSRRALAAFRGAKAVFIQDEYRFVNATLDALEACGVDLVFTCLGPAEAERIYGGVAGLRTQQVLTGYVPHWLTHYPPIPLSARKTVVGYRGRTYPAWHGEQGREKIRIGKLFKRDAPRFGLSTDIAWSERSRLYGRDWVNFIRNCQAVLAVESGASVFDFDGAVAARTESFAALVERPHPIPALARKPSYEMLRDRFFAGREDQIDIAQISPRVFEAIALRTLIIAYPGRYSGVLEPWRHYVPLDKDHGNMAQVAAVLRDPERVAEIITNAYAEIALNPAYGYGTMIDLFDARITEAAAGRPPAATDDRADARFRRAFPFKLIDNPHDVRRPHLVRRLAAAAIRRLELGGLARRLRRRR